MRSSFTRSTNFFKSNSQKPKNEDFGLMPPTVGFEILWYPTYWCQPETFTNSGDAGSGTKTKAYGGAKVTR